MATVLYHVSSSVNRDSIAVHGLDWRRTSERGIAGSLVPEQDGVFLARDRGEAGWFVRMGAHHALLDVWEVTLDQDFETYEPGVDLPCSELGGHLCWMESIPSSRLRLIEQDLRPEDRDGSL